MKLIQPVRNGLKEIRQKKTSIRPVSVSAAKMREGGKVAAGDLLCHPSPGAGFWGCKWSHSLHLHFHSHWSALPLPLPALLQFLPACVAHSHEWDVAAPMSGPWMKREVREECRTRREISYFPITLVDPSLLRIKFSFLQNKRKVLLSNRIPLQQTFPYLKGKMQRKKKRKKLNLAFAEVTHLRPQTIAEQ